MNKMKRLLPVLALACLFSGPVRALPCEFFDTPPLPTISCDFAGFTNSPISSSLFLDAPGGNLVVCNQIPVPDTEWGVSWQVPVQPGRTGHEDWDDLGELEQEPTKDPDDLDGGQKVLQSNAGYTFGARGGEREDRTVTTFMRDVVDRPLDCDANNSNGADLGNCSPLDEDAVLTPVGANSLDLEEPFGAADGNILCADNLINPNNIVADDNNDCSDGARGVVLLGGTQTSKMFQVNSVWAFESTGDSNLLEPGEDLYRDVRPSGLFRANDSVVTIATSFNTIGASSVAYQIFADYAAENRGEPLRTLQSQDPLNHPVQVEDWPIYSGFSRFVFGNSVNDPQTVNFTLPSGEELSGQILAIVPQGPNLGHRTDDPPEASIRERGTKAKDQARGVVDACPTDYFVVVDEGLLGHVDSGGGGLVIPTLNQWVLILLATVLMLGGAYTLRG